MLRIEVLMLRAMSEVILIIRNNVHDLVQMFSFNEAFGQMVNVSQ